MSYSHSTSVFWICSVFKKSYQYVHMQHRFCTYIQLHIIHTTYFLFGHMSRLQTQGPGGHPPWSMRRLLCQVFYFLKWENQWNPHIKHAYSIHIYIHTGTYRYIQIHYIYIYINVYMAQRLVVPPSPRDGDGPYMYM